MANSISQYKLTKEDIYKKLYNSKNKKSLQVSKETISR